MQSRVARRIRPQPATCVEFRGSLVVGEEFGRFEGVPHYPALRVKLPRPSTITLPNLLQQLHESDFNERIQRPCSFHYDDRLAINAEPGPRYR